MKLAQDIIIRPVITEESMAEVAEKKYTFEVAKSATKIDVAAMSVIKLNNKFFIMRCYFNSL